MRTWFRPRTRHQVSVRFVSITGCHNRSLGNPSPPLVAGREQAGGEINLDDAGEREPESSRNDPGSLLF